MEERIGLAIDVDQTIAGGLIVNHLTAYNKLLELGLSKERILETARNHRTIFEIAEIIEFRKENEEAFQQARAEIRESEEVNLAFTVEEEAIHGMNLLRKGMQLLGYYTIRPDNALQATKKWLAHNSFVGHERVFICKDHGNKIRKVLQDHPENKVILVDDSIKELIQAAINLQATTGNISRIENLILVGYGYNYRELESTFEKYDKKALSSLTIFALPSWREEDVLDLLKKLQRLNNINDISR